MSFSKGIFFFFIFSLSISQSLFSQKTDQVFLLNGNMITCEIVELEVGKLDCKTNDIGRIKIEWDAIDSIWSDKEFEVHLKNGTIVFTTFDSSYYDYASYKFEDMIEIIRIKDRFWSRLDGSVDLGFSYTKSSGIFQLNLDSKVNYSFYRGEVDLNLSTLITVDKDENRTDRAEAKLNYKYFLKNKNFAGLGGGFDRNSELGNNGRYSFGGGMGKNFIYKSKTRLNGSLGVILNQELSTNEASTSTTNGEISGVITFQKFSYNFPNLDLNSDIKIFAGINNWGRIRGEFDVYARVEVISDFYVKVTVYYSFDSNPKDQMASQNDWGTTMSLSYSF